MILGEGVARFDEAPERQEQRLGGLEVVGQPLQLDQRADPRVELLRIDRLAEEVVGAGFEAFDPGRPLLQRADEDHRRQAGLGDVLQRRADVEAGDVGHDHVEQHEIRVLAVHEVERVASVGRGQDLVALAFEQLAKRRDVRLVVVDNQYAAGTGHMGL